MHTQTEGGKGGVREIYTAQRERDSQSSHLKIEHINNILMLM